MNHNIILNLDELLQRALDEDIGSGDVTTQSILTQEADLEGAFIAKEPGVIAGLSIAQRVFELLDPNAIFTASVKDGDLVSAAQSFATIKGQGRALLAGERTALNFMQRMSGIATLTRRFVEAIAGTKAVILDTRKTAPGLRILDKEAVRLGDGSNHRFGLFDMVLIKENHIAAAGGSIAEAVKRVRTAYQGELEIEVEVQNLEEVKEALNLNVNRIMLDNMPLEQMRDAVRICNGRILLEASGNIGLHNVRQIAETGVDFISVGALTHSAEKLDISLLLH